MFLLNYEGLFQQLSILWACSIACNYNAALQWEKHWYGWFTKRVGKTMAPAMVHRQYRSVSIIREPRRECHKGRHYLAIVWLIPLCDSVWQNMSTTHCTCWFINLECKHALRLYSTVRHEKCQRIKGDFGLLIQNSRAISTCYNSYMLTLDKPPKKLLSSYA